MAERKDTARKYSDHSRYSSRGCFRKDALKNLGADEYRWFYRAIRGKSELRQVLRDITSRISCDLILFGHLQDCNLPAGEARAAWAGCTGDGSRRSHWTTAADDRTGRKTEEALLRRERQVFAMANQGRGLCRVGRAFIP